MVSSSSRRINDLQYRQFGHVCLRPKSHTVPYEAGAFHTICRILPTCAKHVLDSVVQEIHKTLTLKQMRSEYPTSVRWHGHVY